jgi:hypothetical protein
MFLSLVSEPPIPANVELAAGISSQIESRSAAIRGWAQILASRLHNHKPIDVSALDVATRFGQVLGGEPAERNSRSQDLLMTAASRRDPRPSNPDA